MNRPKLRLSGPVLDSPRPLELAAFYETLLGWPVARSEGPGDGTSPDYGWAVLRSPDGTQKIEVQWEPHYARPVWPPAEGEQLMMMHLDFGVEDLNEGCCVGDRGRSNTCRPSTTRTCAGHARPRRAPLLPFPRYPLTARTDMFGAAWAVGPSRLVAAPFDRDIDSRDRLGATLGCTDRGDAANQRLSVQVRGMDRSGFSQSVGSTLRPSRH